MQQTAQVARRPRLRNSLWEGPRVALEAANGAMQWLPLLACAPRAESRRVLVLPGFLGGDTSTAPLRRFLRQLGHQPFAWKQGINLGEPQQLVAVVERFQALQNDAEEPLVLIGQSLGGIYAREIARVFPDQVHSVITLGSPYAALDRRSINGLVAGLFSRLSGRDDENIRSFLAEERQAALPMPTTSVYSKSDGVVNWRSCIEAEDHNSENIQVLGSHAGMAINPDVLRVIADRLAADPEAWQKFDRSFGLRPFVYPTMH